MLMRKQLLSLLLIIFSIIVLAGFASCDITIEQPPKVETFLISVESTGSVDNEFVSLKTGDHFFMSCIYDDQNDNLPAKEVPISMCNNSFGTRMDQYVKLESYCIDQATRLAICKKYPKKCK